MVNGEPTAHSLYEPTLGFNLFLVGSWAVELEHLVHHCLALQAPDDQTVARQTTETNVGLNCLVTHFLIRNRENERKKLSWQLGSYFLSSFGKKITVRAEKLPG